MDDLWWYLVRASGIVAVALGVAAMFCGLLFSARDTGRWRRPNWWRNATCCRRPSKRPLGQRLWLLRMGPRSCRR